ncbi:MAG: hypothetical protein ACJ780_13200 [Solirubrobacteraceae bacterium]
MRRTLFAGILPAIAALAALVPAGPAQAREPVPFTPGTVNANRCGFPIFVAPVTNNEYQNVTTLADGSTITQVTGKLVVSFTNENTGKAIVRDVSGPTTTTSSPDGTGTTVGEGNNWWTVGPVSQGFIHEPGLLFTTGRVVFVFSLMPGIDFPVASSYSLSGAEVNGCAMLAG